MENVHAVYCFYVICFFLFHPVMKLYGISEVNVTTRATVLRCIYYNVKCHKVKMSPFYIFQFQET